MSFLDSQFKHLSIRFYAVLSLTCALVLVLTFVSHGSLWSAIVAISGILYAFFAGAKRSICFVFGIFYSCAYAYIAYENKLYGDVMLSLFYLPINIYGLLTWHSYQKTTQVAVRNLTFKGWVVCLVCIALFTFLYEKVLQAQGASFTLLNSFSVVAQSAAFILQVNRYVQNYFFVTLANIVAVLIWFLIFQINPAGIAQLLNMIVFLLIGIYYFFDWKRQAK